MSVRHLLLRLTLLCACTIVRPNVALAQSVPLNPASLPNAAQLQRPASSLDGVALDSALIRLEWNKWAQNNLGRGRLVQPLFAADLVNVGLGATGVQRLGKAESFAMIEAMKIPPTPMELGEWKVVHAGRDGRLVSYTVRALGMRIWNSSLWERRAEGWATVYYQATVDAPMPMPASAK